MSRLIATDVNDQQAMKSRRLSHRHLRHRHRIPGVLTSQLETWKSHLHRTDRLQRAWNVSIITAIAKAWTHLSISSRGTPRVSGYTNRSADLQVGPDAIAYRSRLLCQRSPSHRKKYLPRTNETQQKKACIGYSRQPISSWNTGVDTPTQ
jgi:hypothetical protein